MRPLALHDLTFRLLRDWGVFDPEDRTTPIIDVAPPGDVILLQARQGFFGPEEAFLYDAREEYGRTLTSLFGIPFVIAYDLRAHPDLKEKLRVFWPPDAIAPSSPGPPDDGANAGEPGAAP
ncbi:MAG: hypothetical protein BWZ10_03379 [candidate division BRC1 bacterium ADurb.BinA364]|nr:MAG: hypothetical protein BWZ10_03379 [candidate division BRC1 bacterium ADurb.BinA364]